MLYYQLVDLNNNVNKNQQLKFLDEEVCDVLDKQAVDKNSSVKFIIEITDEENSRNIVAQVGPFDILDDALDFAKKFFFVNIDDGFTINLMGMVEGGDVGQLAELTDYILN